MKTPLPVGPATGAVQTAPPPRRPHRSAAWRVAILFLAPAIVVLGGLIIYPIVYTLIRSFVSADGDSFAGIDNYVDMFTDPNTFGSILHNLIWVLVAPLVCTVLGLIFAVLTERIRWKTAFKLIVFMPMAISMLAAGVIFRAVFQENPDLGVANAIAVGVHDIFAPSSEYPGANPRDDAGIVADGARIETESAVTPGTLANFPVVGVKAGTIADDAPTGAAPDLPASDEISGTVWFDFVRGGGGEPGVLDSSEKALSGVTVEAIPEGATEPAATATTDDQGRYTMTGLDPGTSYTVALPASNFRAAFNGVPWLGPDLINFVVILSYVWIWAGFCMVMVGSGLTAIDRSLLEAARTDGANEWQVFRKVTVPQLMPVLLVIIVTLVINVLKIFDLVYVIPPGASKPAANVIAVQMWQVSFGGGNNAGLGSALSILLLVLVLPAIILNIRRFRSEIR